MKKEEVVRVSVCLIRPQPPPKADKQGVQSKADEGFILSRFDREKLPIAIPRQLPPQADTCCGDIH